MNHLKRLLLVFMLLFVCCSITAQIRDIKENIEQDKSSSSNSESSNDDDVDADFFEFLFFLISTADNAQMAVLSHREAHRELVSFQTKLSLGYDFEKAIMRNLSVRGNYGLFAADVRYTGNIDPTDNLHMIDWQVLMLRIPISSFKLEYGIGFIYILDPEKTYFEQSVGFDWSFMNNSANISGQYRWSQKTSLGSRFRKEYSIEADYIIRQFNIVHFSVMAGFTHQDYFGGNTFNYVKVGIVFRLF